MILEYVPRLQVLLSSGGSASIATQKGDTCLHLAVRFGHTDIAQILVQYGSPVNQKDGKGRSAKQMALALGDEEMIEVLKGEGSQRMNEDRQ